MLITQDCRKLINQHGSGSWLHVGTDEGLTYHFSRITTMHPDALQGEVACLPTVDGVRSLDLLRVTEMPSLYPLTLPNRPY